jgi:hypothetical protein
MLFDTVAAKYSDRGSSGILWPDLWHVLHFDMAFEVSLTFMD